MRGSGRKTKGSSSVSSANMGMPVEVQIWRLSVLFLAGIAVNILFQAYTAFRGVFRPKRFGRHFLDIIFSLAILGAATAVVFLVNWGELRFYVALSIILGFWFSNYLVGELVYSIAYRGFNLGKKGGRWTKSKVIVPSGRFITQTGTKARNWLFPPIPPEEGPEDGRTTDDTHNKGPDDEPQDSDPLDGGPHRTM
jgi:hypothetical protein